MGTTRIGIAPSEYTLPEETRPGGVRLQVTDLHRSLDFYTRTVGFHLFDRTETTASLGAHGDNRSIIELVENKKARPVSRRSRLGLFHVAFLLPERADLARLVFHLGNTDQHIGMSDHLVSEAIYLTDPDGLGIEVYTDRPRNSWQMNGRQLRLVTRPLDVADLLDSRSDVPWRGVPERTRVGHVHLHVGDLDSAEAFYHSALGFEKMVWNYPGALFLSAGGYHHHLGLNTWAAGAPPAGEDDARLMEWSLIVPTTDDVRDIVARLRSTDHDLVRSTDNEAWIQDPWGTTLHLQSSPLSSDSHTPDTARP